MGDLRSQPLSAAADRGLLSAGHRILHDNDRDQLPRTERVEWRVDDVQSRPMPAASHRGLLLHQRRVPDTRPVFLHRGGRSVVDGRHDVQSGEPVPAADRLVLRRGSMPGAEGYAMRWHRWNVDDVRGVRSEPLPAAFWFLLPLGWILRAGDDGSGLRYRAGSMDAERRVRTEPVSTGL
jgi:hypothetical protein